MGRGLLAVPKPVVVIRARTVDGVGGAGSGVVSAVYHVDGLHADVRNVKATVTSVVRKEHM